MTLRALVIALGLALLAPACAQAEADFASIPMPEAVPVMQQADHPLILDVREPDEFAAGHVPGAVNVPQGQVGAWAKERADLKDQPVLVICQSGRRSLKASSELSSEGFTQVTNVEGGFRAWQQRGLPVARP